ncbi:uncharacterized protein PFL1_04126 [Pseudozyma flocculosa PF-1]|uniref:Uncharacterized protein n=2 Tax=Pseudozyma flocculosa TaxID=84751 RepID=A0A5C3ESX3_9BASI|nr:uncharacterized protein PFL1_04126 [Pseudozyma flocculosa PF-1]EPQ28299.1 hypothetical protein PFL1_04126 [Pseudozyma flocculosa PF-1]SPO35444.1 uncharacterized protein PSFLO_00915 [Pseudozyma flocculosa]
MSTLMPSSTAGSIRSPPPFEPGDRVVFWTRLDGRVVKLEGLVIAVEDEQADVHTTLGQRSRVVQGVSFVNIVAWDQAIVLGFVSYH